jgi:hypothetical protein
LVSTDDGEESNQLAAENPRHLRSTCQVSWTRLIQFGTLLTSREWREPARN